MILPDHHKGFLRINETMNYFTSNGASRVDSPARPQIDISEIHNRLGPLADFLHQRYGILVGRTSGGDTEIECPWHTPGHTTSATVHEWPDGRQTVNCWAGCIDKPVDVIGAIEQLEGCATGEAIQLIAGYLGITSSSAPSPRPKPRNRSYQPRQTSADDVTAAMDAARLDDPQHIAELLRRYGSFRGWDIDTLNELDIHPANRTFRDGKTEVVMRHPFTVRGVPVGWQDRCKSPRDKWMGGYKQQLPAYNIDALMHLDNDHEVVVVEGVSDAASLLDAYGTSYPAIGLVGAASVRRELIAALKGLRVVVIGDNDAAGAGMVQKLEQYSSSFELVQVLVPSQFKDLTEWKQSIKDRNEFAEIVELSIIAALEASNG